MARTPARTAKPATAKAEAPRAGRSTEGRGTSPAVPIKPVRGRAAQAKSAPADARLGISGNRLDTPSDLKPEGVQAVSQGLRELLADFFALYMKTKNLHWHVSGPHFYSYHLLLDEQADQIFAATDPAAERARKIGGTTLRSIGQVSQFQRLRDNDATYVDPLEMLRELHADNKACAANMRKLHETCDEHDDVATASLLEEWIDQAERRAWFLFEASRQGDASGH